MSVFDRHKSSALAAKTVTTQTTVDSLEPATDADVPAALLRYRKAQEQGEAVRVSPRWVYPLARQAETEGFPETALALVEGFSSRYPAHPDVVRNYLLAATILADHFGEKEKAIELLRHLAKQYRDHPDQSLIDTQLRLLHR